MYCDAHTHLNDDTLATSWNKHLDAFAHVGGTLLINIGINQMRNELGIQITRQASNHNVHMYTTVGIHPCEITAYACRDENINQEIAHLTSLLDAHSDIIVAIGETGTDAHYDPGDTMHTQLTYFRAQCDLARIRHLPVVVHSRNDIESIYTIVREYPDIVFYIHSWTYPKNALIRLLSLHDTNKLYIGFNGIVTFKNAHDVHESVNACPLDQLICETDAPYLAPVPHRGSTNYPHYVTYVYDYIATKRHLHHSDLVERVHQNVCTLYQLDTSTYQHVSHNQ